MHKFILQYLPINKLLSILTIMDKMYCAGITAINSDKKTYIYNKYDMYIFIYTHILCIYYLKAKETILFIAK